MFSTAHLPFPLHLSFCLLHTGCLFEKRLCSREQFCSDDKLFGQCRSSRHDQVQYQVSVPVLQRLQEVLKELMIQGFSWQDEITQHIIAKELSHIPHTRTQKVQNKVYSSSNSEPGPAQSYMDYMVLDPHQSSSLRMQALPVDPYSYLQEDMTHSLHPHTSMGYQRPPSRAGAQQRDRDRQLLEDAVSLYLSSTQPSFRHRGAAALPAAPYYEDLDFPLEYGEDYTLQEQASSAQRNNKKIPQDYSSLAGLDGDLNFYKEYLFGIETLVFAILGILSLKKTELFVLCCAFFFTHNALCFPPQTIVEGSDKVTKGAKPPLPVSALPSTPTYQRAPTQPPSTPAPATVPKEDSGDTVGPTLSVKDLDIKEKITNILETVKDGTNTREEYGYIVTNQSVVGSALTFRIRQNSLNLSAEDVANKAVAEKNFLEGETGLKIIQTGVGERSEWRGLPQATRVGEGSRGVVLTMVAMACVGTVLLVALAIACLRHHTRQLASGKLGLGPEAGAETHFDYQELCRQHMAAKSSFTRPEPGGRRGTDTSRVSSVSSQFSDGPQHSPSSHSSTPSWSEEPAQSNMDISTGHMILAYMEDHLKNKDRLRKEWEALCSYQAEPSSVSIAQSESNIEKNRYPDFVPYDHLRVKIKAEVNPSKEDYINASTIIDHDPRLPAYIATQGPLPHTIADFWQMVWENGCTVIVMMTALVEDGEKQCERYWPDEGSSLYNIYEVNLVSEHIWCKDFLVRSFYLKNVQTQETRTLTQFHLLSWPAQGIPSSTRPLLDFRRKVNKCYRGRSCPIIVHCSDGTGRTGTYILIDMVLNRMAKGVKEIDIAATLEHIRDQRPSMVRTKDQFEFALTAVAEEVNAILKALPQ
uniref:Receptor-type tyrosine-protein phosphatase-like N n=1 Tax=Sinocyclocheilus anshuiensis TaxID=1608454 RepID=A0A671KK28_9TELE